MQQARAASATPQTVCCCVHGGIHVYPAAQRINDAEAIQRTQSPTGAHWIIPFPASKQHDVNLKPILGPAGCKFARSRRSSLEPEQFLKTRQALISLQVTNHPGLAASSSSCLFMEVLPVEEVRPILAKVRHHKALRR